MRQCQSRSSSQRAFPTHLRALLPHRVDELDDVHLFGEVAVEARARKSLPVALHRPAAVLGRQRPWGRLIDAVRQYTSPGAAFVSITPRKPQMHIAVSVSTEQAGRVRARPEDCTNKGGILLGRRHDNSSKAKGEA